MDNERLKALINRLSDFCAQAIEQGVAFATARSHYEIGIEHIVIKMLEEGGGDFDRALRYFRVDLDGLWNDLLESVGTRRAGNSGRPAFSPFLLDWLDRGWTSATLHLGHDTIRSGALLDALIEMAPLLNGPAYERIGEIPLHTFRAQYAAITDGSVEGYGVASEEPTGEGGGAHPKESSSDAALARFTDDLTARARAGEIDPVLGRDFEIRALIDILTRRRKNNPLLVGDPGVGKTAIVEGLAQRIVDGTVPEMLRDVELRALDLGRLKAGAGVKGEFEKRLKQVIDDVKSWHRPVVLFIDEAHTLIGAGGDAGLGDAANLLKPALARGELKTVAATTWSEYKQYFETDSALERRFQVVKVEEPDVEQAIVMLSGLKHHYAEHHQVHITDAAIDAAVRLSARYIHGRQLPDKAIDLLDTASARVRMGQSVEPGVIESERAHLEYLERRLTQLNADVAHGVAVAQDRLDSIAGEIDETRTRLAGWSDRWDRERDLVAAIREHSGNGTASETQRAELAEMQGDAPMVQPEVDASAVAAVVSEWTGVPLGRMLKSDVGVLVGFEDQLAGRVIGQEAALTLIANRLRMARAGLNRPEAPLGVFLLAGPSGIGKTETAHAVADALFGGERFLVTINMSEYQEPHTVSQLKGSPPGYVGYGKGGVLTEAVRQRPHSVILLDEIEKAHPEVINLFYQVFDKGIMRDGEGREIDFRNTVIFMTTNLGAETIIEATVDESDEAAEGEAENERTPISTSELIELVHPDLLRRFAPALLGRIQVVPYSALDSYAMQHIVALKLDQAAQRLDEAHGIELRCHPDVISHIAAQCRRTDAGARYVHTVLEQRLLPGVARRLLGFLADGDTPVAVSLAFDEAEGLVCDFLVNDDEIAEQPSLTAVAP